MYIDGYLRCYAIEQDFDYEDVYLVKFFSEETETDVVISVRGSQVNDFKIGSKYKVQFLHYEELEL